MNILHIAVHLGGGVGKAIAGIATRGQQDSRDCHRILLLQRPEKEGWVQYCREHDVSVVQWDGTQQIFQWADVLVVSWWNHPAMAQFLAHFLPCSAARVLWCHVNGVYYPFLPFPLAAAFDRVAFTSRYSMYNPAWTEEERRIIQSRASLVYGMGEFWPAEIRAKEYHPAKDSFVIGYVGTLNYGKIHPDFVAYCQTACEKVSNLHFVMVGDRDGNLEYEIHAAGLTERFTFTGFVEDVFAYMREFDVFGYLLNPTHYGTTENVLLEAMACSLPVVVLRQNVEQYIVPQKAGFLVETPQEYAEAIKYLASHPDACIRMGNWGREHVVATYNAAQNAAELRRTCEEAILAPRKQFTDNLSSVLGNSPWAWFLTGLGQHDKEFFLSAERKLSSNEEYQRKEAIELLRTCPPIFREKRKSSLLHFADTYPDDDTLRSISAYIR